MLLNTSGRVIGHEQSPHDHTGDYSDIVLNTAQFSHPTSNGSADATFTVIGPPVLNIAKTVTPGTDVPYHTSVTYTLTLSNSSLADADGSRLTDTLPISTTFDHCT